MKNLAAFSFLPQPKSISSTPLAMTDFSGTFRNSSQGGSYQNSGMGFKKFSRPFKKSPTPFIVLAVVVFIIAVVGLTTVIRKSTTNITQTIAQSVPNTNTQQVSIAKPLATQTLNKTFNFPLKDATGKTVSKFQYEIQSAELDNEVIIKGQEATAVQGKAFLVLNLKITNNFNKSVQLNTRDYVRLVVDNASDKLAADIHNDPVDVEAISTKFTRLGFPVNLSAKSLKLEVGEIDGPKQTVQLNLH